MLTAENIARDVSGRKLPEFWPFSCEADWEEWRALKDQMMAAHKAAHSLWETAIANR